MVCKATPKNILHHYLDFAAHSQLLLRGCITSGGAGPAVVLVFLGTAVSQDEGRSAWIKACYGADEKDVCSSLLSHQNVHMQIESSSAPFSPLPSAPLRQHPYSVTNRGWLLCQESGSCGVLKAGLLSLLCGCQEEKCERGIASIVTKVCWGTGRGVLPRPSGAGLLSQLSHGCWTGGNETEQDFCAPVEGKRGSEVVP